jgi:hypothetical protein
MRPRSAFAVVISISIAFGIAACEKSSGNEPPPEVRRLERTVSMKLAHVRDADVYRPEQREKLKQAHDLDMQAEKAIGVRDYSAAKDDLEKADEILKTIDQ